MTQVKESVRAAFDEAFLRRLERLRLVARRRLASARAGRQRSRRRGAGLELAEHRAYAPGDDFRRVDWNAFRRLERLYVAEREEESERTVVLALDRSASMGRGGKLDLARALVAALAYVALADDDRVLLASFAGGEVTLSPPRKGSAAIFSLFRFLDGVSAAGTTSVAAASRAVARGPRRPGLAVLVTDFLEEGPARTALRALAEGGREVVLVHIVAPEDESCALRGERRLVDVETGEELVLSLDARAREEYGRVFSHWVRELEATARSLGATHVRVRSDQKMEDAALTVLGKAGVLG
ncbi:DUF58 domain-containing protein [bacterium]|nr:DUF58 domain-containing protein [bacterium]